MKNISSNAGSVTREQKDHIFLVGLDRAAKRNAFDSAMLEDLALALGHYEADENLRCAVLFAHGEHFTSGLDLVELAPIMSPHGFSYPPQSIDPWGVSGPRRTKPVVVAVQGSCWTVGIELILNADIVVADSGARFAHLEVMRGIPPSGGSTARFPQVAGWPNAMRYMLTGEQFDATQALHMRLLTEVVEPGQALSRAIEYAERIAQAAPLAVKATLQSALRARADNQDSALAALNETLFELLKTRDVQEGLMAMMQRRAPVFEGR